MSAAKHLPIYKDAHRLVHLLHETTRKAPRDLRVTVVKRLLEEAVELLVDFDTANRQKDMAERKAWIERGIQRAVRADVLLSVALEQHCLSTAAAGQCMEKIDAVMRQAAGWAAHTATKLVPTGKSEPEPSI